MTLHFHLQTTRNFQIYANSKTHMVIYPKIFCIIQVNCTWNVIKNYILLRNITCNTYSDLPLASWSWFEQTWIRSSICKEAFIQVLPFLNKWFLKKGFHSFTTTFLPNRKFYNGINFISVKTVVWKSLQMNYQYFW